jgi:hypothetical protein
MPRHDARNLSLLTVLSGPLRCRLGGSASAGLCFSLRTRTRRRMVHASSHRGTVYSGHFKLVARGRPGSGVRVHRAGPFSAAMGAPWRDPKAPISCLVGY